MSSKSFLYSLFIWFFIMAAFSCSSQDNTKIENVTRKNHNLSDNKLKQAKLVVLKDDPKIDFVEEKINNIFQKEAYYRYYFSTHISEVDLEREAYCDEIKSLIKDLYALDLSSKRENLILRTYRLIKYSGLCEIVDIFPDRGNAILEDEWQAHVKQVPDSSFVLRNQIWEKYTGENYQLMKELFLDALDLYPFSLLLYQDIETMRNNSTLVKENSRFLTKAEARKLQQDYCKKAVELKQWDHIYYLTDSMQIMPCALGESNEWWDYDNNRQIQCKCKEAMQLVVKHWPDEYIERAIYEHLNPHVERPKDEEVYAQEIKDYRKELFGVAHKYFGRPLSQ